MTDLTVKYFNSGMTGAPQISNNWGDLVTMLDACLVNGFALKAIDTLTCTDGVATATISAGHAYQREQVVQIAGADQPEYNGQFRVLDHDHHVHLRGDGTPASPATTSTSLTAKVAPLGWEKPFAGTNKAAYRSKNPQSPQNILLIDNSLKTPNYTTTWAKWANVGIVEDLSDIDTIVGAQAPMTRTTRRRTGSRSPAASGVGTSGITGGPLSTKAPVTAAAARATGCSSATTACSSSSAPTPPATAGTAATATASATSPASSPATTTPRCWVPTTTTPA
jgi:hypothetical protein